MGQKTNPIGLRLKINKTWDSRWYDEKNYSKNLLIDLKIRQFIKKELHFAGISKIVIERPTGKTMVTISTPRPGVLIGKKGTSIDQLKKKLTEINQSSVVVNILEVRKPDLDAQLVADSIANQLERRIAFRRAMKRAMQNTMRMGALGMRVCTTGRLGGAEIARKEWYREGRVPLQTLRANVDFGVSSAHTTYGVCGIKVWIYKGNIMDYDPMASERRLKETRNFR